MYSLCFRKLAALIGVLACLIVTGCKVTSSSGLHQGNRPPAQSRALDSPNSTPSTPGKTINESATANASVQSSFNAKPRVSILSIGLDLNSLAPIVAKQSHEKMDAELPSKLRPIYQSFVIQLENSLINQPALAYWDIDIIRDDRYYIAAENPGSSALYVVSPYKPISQVPAEIGYMLKGLNLDIGVLIHFSFNSPVTDTKEKKKKQTSPHSDLNTETIPLELSGHIQAFSQTGTCIIDTTLHSSPINWPINTESSSGYSSEQLLLVHALFDSFQERFTKWVNQIQ